MEIKLNNTTLNIKAATQEVNILASTRANHLLTISSNIGEDMQAVASDMSQLYNIVKSADTEKALVMVQNLNNSLFTLMDSERALTNRARAFAAILCDSDDVKKDNFLSDSYLDKKLLEWTKDGLTNKQIEDGIRFFLNASVS